ncbi:MAG: hypothetical protein HKN24_11970 [Acidimicrobiales bacterium]|nr:hypothetical protein [Acidimicrobiales bacterium]
MVLGRSQDPPPPRQWQGRLGSALALARQNVSDPGILRRLEDVEGALWNADRDRLALIGTLDGLQPERASRELKDALRENFENPSEANLSLAESLQLRHESINALKDRIEELERTIDKTTADVEALAASSAQLALRPGNSAAGVEQMMHHLTHDLEVLSNVHEQLAGE